MSALTNYSKWDSIDGSSDSDSVDLAQAPEDDPVLSDTRHVDAAPAPAAPAPAAPAASAPAVGGSSAPDSAPGPDDFDRNVARGLDALRNAEPGVCADFLAELARTLHNAPQRKRAAVDRGALAAVVGAMGRHAARADVQAQGARALRALCFNNALGRAAAPAAGAIRALAAALDAHAAADVSEECVWALVVICADDEANLKWCSRLCADAMRRVRGDVQSSPRASAMAAFLCEKIKEWRTGGNR